MTWAGGTESNKPHVETILGVVILWSSLSLRAYKAARARPAATAARAGLRKVKSMAPARNISSPRLHRRVTTSCRPRRHRRATKTSCMPRPEGYYYCFNDTLHEYELFGPLFSGRDDVHPSSPATSAPRRTTALSVRPLRLNMNRPRPPTTSGSLISRTCQ